MSRRGKRGGKGRRAAAAEEDDDAPQVTEEQAVAKISPRVVTGVLSSHPMSRDIKIDGFSLRLGPVELLMDTSLELNHGRRYGLIGLNGSGKSTLLDCIAEREVPVPAHIDIFHLRHEIAASDTTALEAVVEELENKRIKLEAEAEELAGNADQQDTADLITEIYERLDELEVSTAESRAAEILYGLGFTPEMQRKATREFSGGWRMRISLAKALFIKPTMLLLDEPTNHLDLEATVWLEKYLQNYNRILVLVSHSQDFLNNVCTNIMRIHLKRLTVWSGNYDTYMQTRLEQEENQMKQYQWEQDKMAEVKEFVARFGHGTAKLAAQAKSREKALSRMQERGLTEAVVTEHVKAIPFPDCGKLPPPVMQFTMVTFTYNPEIKPLFTKLDFGVDLESRIALVGPNGAGKSTLLKLMIGELTPTDGMVKRHQHLRIGWYHQHLQELLDMTLTPLEFMLKSYPDTQLGEMGFRRVLGTFGISGQLQSTPLNVMSDGQKSRVVIAHLAFRQPHLLLLDEPTNHLDLETIDALAEGIRNFEGGLVLVSHDFRLINQVANEIWEVKNGVHKWKGDIMSYKKHLAAQVDAQRAKVATQAAKDRR